MDNKRKRCILEKLNMLSQIKSKMDSIYATASDDDEIEDLEENNPELRRLFTQKIGVEKEIQRELIETKYFPLCGLSSLEIQSIKNADLDPEYCPEVYEFTNGGKTLIPEGVYWGMFDEKVIEEHLELELLKRKEEMKRRIGLIKFIILPYSLDSHIQELYWQIVSCYIYGFFAAACVLSRALIEYIGKKYIESHGLGEQLYGKGKPDKPKPLSIVSLLAKLGVDSEIRKLYKEISDKANNILHATKATILEKDARLSINDLQTFLTKFPK